MIGHLLDNSPQRMPEGKGILATLSLALLTLALLIVFPQKGLAFTPVALKESYAGNMSFVLTGGSFRTQHNNSNSCSNVDSHANQLSGLPSDAVIEKAYLYWAASGSPDPLVTLNGELIQSDTMYTLVRNGFQDFYNAVADVTSQIQRQGNASYRVSGIEIDDSSTYCNSQIVLGGWALMVIYSSDQEDFRVLNVYEGFQSFQNSSLTLIPNNFKLPSNPTGKHAHITWEGDDTLGTDGEFLSFEGNLLTDSANPSDNQFNSSSNVQGGFTSYGVDIDEYDISPYLNEGATEVSTTYSAGQDLVFLSAEIISVSNIPVADLAVTTSNPTGWQAGSTVTKKFTISNNGPNDVPTQSVEFTTTLPSELSFAGVQGDSDWNCNQSGRSLTCRYQSKLRAGWSDYLDLTFDVASGTAGRTADFSVSVNHDNAPYEIFDNQLPNNTYQFDVPIGSIPVVDLSASSKTYTNLSGDLLLAGDTLQYVITIDDASDLNVSNIRVYDDLPGNITGYSILSIPSGANNSSSSTGGANGTGFLDIRNINLASGDVEQIVLEVYVSSNAPKGASLQNTANLTASGEEWTVDTGDITVVQPDLSVSTKSAADKNGGWLLPGEIVQYVITLDDNENLELSGIQITDHLPANISSFNILNLPAGASDFSVIGGGNNGTGYIDIRNISLPADSTLDIEIEVTIASDAPDGVSMKNTATLALNSSIWNVESNDLTVSVPGSPASGNKPLYLDNSDLTRLLPSNNTVRDFRHNGVLTWALDTDLQSDLSLAAGDMEVNLAIRGYRTGSVQTRFIVTLFYNDNQGGGFTEVGSARSSYGNFRVNTYYDVSVNLNVAAPMTVPAGSTFHLRVDNESSNGQNNQWSQIDLYTTNPNTGKHSAIILNATTVINVDSISVWDATYGDPNGNGNGNQLNNSQPDTDLFIRAVVSDPFGAFDITAADIEVIKGDGSSYDFSSHSDGNQNRMNQVDTTSDDQTTSTKTYEKQITLQETGESIGNWSIAITAYEGMESAPDQVTHARVIIFKINPFQPNITLSKSIEVISDPINGTEKPKAIPGAELKYTIFAKNSGRGGADNGSVVLTDEVPPNSELFIGNLTCSGNAGPVCFIDGVPPNNSGLTFTFINIDSAADNLEFSIDGNDYTYVPDDPDNDGYDPAIRYIRIKPQGSFNPSDKAVSFEPEFNFEFQIRLQ